MVERSQVTFKVNTIWPIVLTAVLVFSHLIYPSRVWIALLWMVGGLTALAYYWTRQLARHVHVRRALLYGWVQVGDRLEEQFTLIDNSWLPVLWAEVIDESNLPGYHASRVAACGGHGVARWTTAQVCTRRGLYTLGPWSLRAGDPFGFFSVLFRQDDFTPIAVYPPVVDLPQIALPRGLTAGRSRARRRTLEATVDVSQTRYYQPEDPLRLIHWPSTAHRGRLIVKEADTEVSGDMWIVLDLDERVQAGEGEESTEEYGVILAASLADRTLRQNRSVGLLAHGVGEAIVPLGQGRSHMLRILHTLATVQAGGEYSLAQVLHGMRRSIGQGTTILLITPSCETDWVDALLPFTRWGMSPSIVLIDPESFGKECLPGTLNMEAMRGLLVRAGLTAHIIRQGHPFQYLVKQKRRGYWEFKTSPLGRAVVVRRPEEA